MPFRELNSVCLADEAVLRCLVFLLDLPVIKLDELADDDKHCSICLEDFAEPDEAVRLTCSHIVGLMCLSKTVDPLTRADPRCPYFRQVIYNQIEVCQPCRQEYSEVRSQQCMYEGLSGLNLLVLSFLLGIVNVSRPWRTMQSKLGVPNLSISI